MKKSLIVGFRVGVIAGIAGIATAYLISTLTDLWFTQLNWVSIGIASIIPNVIGALIFTKLRKSARPFLYYALLTAGVTLLLTLIDLANPPEANFGIVAHPVHVIVALLSIWLIPKGLRHENNHAASPTVKSS